jgi:hypothetical protein
LAKISQSAAATFELSLKSGADGENGVRGRWRGRTSGTAAKALQPATHVALIARSKNTRFVRPTHPKQNVAAPKENNRHFF